MICKNSPFVKVVVLSGPGDRPPRPDMLRNRDRPSTIVEGQDAAASGEVGTTAARGDSALFVYCLKPVSPVREVRWQSVGEFCTECNILVSPGIDEFYCVYETMVRHSYERSLDVPDLQS